MSSSPICLDASVVVRLLVEPEKYSVKQLFVQWNDQSRQFIAPALLFYQVTNALHQYHRHGYFSDTTVVLTLNAALALPIDLHSTKNLHRRAVKLAGRLNLPTAYDAHYLALSELLAAEFWTTDRRLFNAVHPSFSWVHLIE